MRITSLAFFMGSLVNQPGFHGSLAGGFTYLLNFHPSKYLGEDEPQFDERIFQMVEPTN